MFQGEIPDCVHQNHVIRVRPDTQVLLPEYLNTNLNSPVGQQSMVALARTMAGLYALVTERLRGLVIPIPTLTRQRDLVTTVASWRHRMALIGARQATQSTAITDLRAQALTHAFAGGV